MSRGLNRSEEWLRETELRLKAQNKQKDVHMAVAKPKQFTKNEKAKLKVRGIKPVVRIPTEPSKWTLRRRERLANGMCQECGKREKQNLVSPFCYVCAEVRRIYSKKLIANHKESGLCNNCGEVPSRNGKTLCNNCASLGIERARQRRKKIKEYLVNLLGGVCVDCSEADIRVLTIDHTNGDGNEHRKELNVKAGSVFYAKLYRQMREFPDRKRELQLLCFNCHAKKDLSPWWTK